MKRPYLWIIAAVAAVYGQVLFFQFTYLDDYTLLVQNSDLFIHPANLFRVFTTDFLSSVTGGEYYRPLLAASLIINGIIAGQSPFFFHLTDVLLHLGVVILLYKFLLRLTGSKSSALFGSLVFAVHPLLLQTVAWIPARNDSLAALFILWYLLVFDQALENPSVKKYYIYAALAFALALASKEIAIIIPVLSVLYVLLAAKQAAKYKTLLRFVPIWAAVFGLWFLGRSIALTESSAISFTTIFSSVYFSLPAVIVYLGKMVFPFGLSTYPTIADLRLAPGLAALAILGFGFLISKQKSTAVAAFGGAWFFAVLLLSLTRVNPTPYDEILEHRAYLPMIGVLIFVLQFDWFKGDWFKSRFKFAAASAVIAGLAVINVVHASAFRNGQNYWEQAAATSPSSPFAHRQLGAMRHQAGDLAVAEAEYKKVIFLNPEETLVYNNLGLLYATSGRAAEAEILYHWEIATNPDFDKTYMNLGNLYWEQGRREDAKWHWQKTIELNPYFFEAYRNLAIYYYDTDRYDEGLDVLGSIIDRGGKIDADLLEAYKPYLPTGNFK